MLTEILESEAYLATDMIVDGPRDDYAAGIG
jgi:hypothetical protein